MRRTTVILLLVAFGVVGTYANPPKKHHDQLWASEWAPRWGATFKTDMIRVYPPPIVFSNITITCWIRLASEPRGGYAVPRITWKPHLRPNSSLDMLDGAGGYGTNAPLNLDDGALEIPGLIYDGDPITWAPRSVAGQLEQTVSQYGLFVVAGVADNPVTVTVGGHTKVLTPEVHPEPWPNMAAGEWSFTNRYFQAVFDPTFDAITKLPSADVNSGFKIEGTGTARIALAEQPKTDAYDVIDGQQSKGGGDYLPESKMTNEWQFITWRISTTDTNNQMIVTTMGTVENWHLVQAVQLRPPADYLSGFTGTFAVGPASLVYPYEWEAARGRLAIDWISDEELEAEWERGKKAIQSRKVGLLWTQ